MKSWPNSLALGAALGVAFLAGQLLPRVDLSAQGGRGPLNPPPPSSAQPPNNQPSGGPPQVVYSEESGASSASANGFVAVTGSYGVGTSVLYLVDTVNRQLAVYEARGGSSEQRRIVLVGARKIDLDLQLEGYNDRSEYDYRDLKDAFAKRGGKDHDVGTGLEPAEGRK